MNVSIFDRFVSKETGEPQRKSSHPTPYRKMFSELEASGAEAKERCPDDRGTIEDFVWALKEASRARYKKALEGEMKPMKAEARFFLSKDRMSAYACLLPPENDGAELTLEEFLGDLRYEGIRYGVLQEDIQREFALGYFHLFPVARGKPPTAGDDGRVTELFHRLMDMHL